MDQLKKHDQDVLVSSRISNEHQSKQIVEQKLKQHFLQTIDSNMVQKNKHPIQKQIAQNHYF